MEGGRPSAPGPITDPLAGTAPRPRRHGPAERSLPSADTSTKAPLATRADRHAHRSSGDLLIAAFTLVGDQGIWHVDRPHVLALVDVVHGDDV